MDTHISSWILEFLLRQPIEDWAANSLLSILPISNTDLPLKKTILLRRISSEISKNRVSQKTLDSLELIADLDRDIGTAVSDSMRSAYCAVIVECTAQILRDQSSAGDAIEMFWKCKVDDRSGLVSDRLKDLEAIVRNPRIRESVFSKDTLKSALDSVRVYLEETMEEMGPSFLEFAAELMIKEGRDGVAAESSVDNGDGDMGMESTVEVGVRRKLPSSLIGTSKERTQPREKGQLNNKYDCLPTPKVKKVLEELKSSRIDLQAVVEDPLPDALKKAARVQSNMGRELNWKVNSIATLRSQVHSQLTHLKKIMEREQINQKGSEENENCVDTSIHNSSVDKIRDKILQPSLMVQNETARTYEWDDNSIDIASDNSPNCSRRIRLPSPNHRAVSPLKKQEITRFVKRKRVMKWSILEEEALRNGVKEYGKGNWKLILNCYCEVFKDRTAVDLKDKWRNMT